MSASQKTNILQNRPRVVGTIPTPAALAAALKLKAGAVDAFELRVDHFADDLALLFRAAPRLEAPLIVTARHPAEGGFGKLSLARRTELYAQFLPVAAFIDVELRSFAAMAATLATARASGVQIIASAHYFHSSPPRERLEALRQRAFAEGADVFKVATLTRTMADVSLLLRFLIENPRRPVSAMGMGACGKISRLLLAQAGSVLNYGYLDAVQVPGQWPAPLLKERLAELS